MSHVRIGETKIECVKAFLRTVDGLVNPLMYDRNAVVQSIDNDDKWYTCVLKEKRGGRNIWTLKAEIHVVEADGEKFIRTDGNKMKADNLGELPSL